MKQRSTIFIIDEGISVVPPGPSIQETDGKGGELGGLERGVFLQQFE